MEKMDKRIIHFNVAISILLNENDSDGVINGANSFCKEYLRKIMRILALEPYNGERNLIIPEVIAWCLG